MRFLIAVAFIISIATNANAGEPTLVETIDYLKSKLSLYTNHVSFKVSSTGTIYYKAKQGVFTTEEVTDTCHVADLGRVESKKSQFVTIWCKDLRKCCKNNYGTPSDRLVVGTTEFEAPRVAKAFEHLIGLSSEYKREKDLFD